MRKPRKSFSSTDLVPQLDPTEIWTICWHFWQDRRLWINWPTSSPTMPEWTSIWIFKRGWILGWRTKTKRCCIITNNPWSPGDINRIKKRKLKFFKSIKSSRNLENFSFSSKNKKSENRKKPKGNFKNQNFRKFQIFRFEIIFLRNLLYSNYPKFKKSSLS